jgi:hypothetical protein
VKATQANITRLAKAICASHMWACYNPASVQARAIPWPEVEALWFAATTKERADYRWEAAQVLRTLDTGASRAALTKGATRP